MNSGRARLVIAALIALFALVGYFTKTTVNPITGETQRVALTPEEEVALGRKAAPEMAAQMGGLSRNAEARALVQRVGGKLASGGFAARSPYKFSFHVLADPKTVNAFALPGGPVFITEGLLRRLRTEGELAAVLGHEVGHVLARHSSERLLSPDCFRSRWRMPRAGPTIRRRVTGPRTSSPRPFAIKPPSRTQPRGWMPRR